MKHQRGFTLIEILIAVSLFLIVAVGIYASYANLIEVVGRTRTHTLATSLLNREIEIVRNLPYDSIGIIGGVPAGVIASSTTIVYEGQQFVLAATVHSVDDPFDGRVGGAPSDTALADYRLVQLTLTCPTCFRFVPLSFTTWASPQHLEGSTKNGALFIDVFDASSNPFSGADVSIINNNTLPTITISDITGANGTYELVDTPTSTLSYRVTVSKTGYSTDKTYAADPVNNPNPQPAYATVASQQVTEIAFAIDKLSTLQVTTQDFLCKPIPAITLNQVGDKLIGVEPDVPKYANSVTTNQSGTATLNNLEWDTYTFTNTSGSYDIAGVTPFNPFDLDPGVHGSIDFVMEPHTTNSLLVTSEDESGDPLPEATVTITDSKGNDTVKLSGERFLTDTDWSAGTYTSQDGTIEVSNPAGTLKLKKVGNSYPTSTHSYLISQTFDFGTATTTLHSFSWNPTSQPAQTGADSVKFQFAANNDNATWNYIGPDGTAETYFTTAVSDLSAYNNKRYFRYKAYINTVDQNYTPSITDVQLRFTSACVSSYQALFSNLTTGDYTVAVAKDGYQTTTSTVTVASGWQEDEETLYP